VAREAEADPGLVVGGPLTLLGIGPVVLLRPLGRLRRVIALCRPAIAVERTP
jgi:hypothetical protein